MLARAAAQTNIVVVFIVVILGWRRDAYSKAPERNSKKCEARTPARAGTPAVSGHGKPHFERMSAGMASSLPVHVPERERREGTGTNTAGLSPKPRNRPCGLSSFSRQIISSGS